jgi:hypothetical protein
MVIPVTWKPPSISAAGREFTASSRETLATFELVMSWIEDAVVVFGVTVGVAGGGGGPKEMHPAWRRRRTRRREGRVADFTRDPMARTPL